MGELCMAEEEANACGCVCKHNIIICRAWAYLGVGLQGLCVVPTLHLHGMQYDVTICA